ncbi:MAG: hypothetical protein ISS78_03285, partial [Phycisphaerae bacterium]|nr:hypothetical protein [Phycisphaerae bacterium]
MRTILIRGAALLVGVMAASAPPAAGAPAKEGVQSMFYKAKLKETGNMWDTWLYHHKGTDYLYSLAKSSRRWDNISRA